MTHMLPRPHAPEFDPKPPDPRGNLKRTGVLTLIGCGPGAADLLTLRAARRIAAAELILYDRLVDPEVLEHAAPTAEKLYVGKKCGDGGVQQTALNGVIAEALKAGRRVARLKSGDPMVFGRAAEEIAVALELRAEIEIVPGVTSALAAAADAAIPVTERMELQSIAITTGWVADPRVTPDWAHQLQPGVCLAFYMSVAQAERIQAALLASGAPPEAPADWVEHAGRPNSRTIATSLGRLAQDARAAHVQNPAILLVRYPRSLARTDANAPQPCKPAQPWMRPVAVSA